MSINHLKIVQGATDSGVSRSSSAGWRDIALALLVTVILFVGILGGALAPQSSADLQIPGVEPYQEWAPTEQEDFVHFPSLYVNQGMGIEEHIPTF